LKRGGHQHQVDEQTGAKRDEQEDAETTEFAIPRHDRTKLPENRRAHKRFSRSAEVNNDHGWLATDGEHRVAGPYLPAALPATFLHTKLSDNARVAQPRQAAKAYKLQP